MNDQTIENIKNQAKLSPAEFLKDYLALEKDSYTDEDRVIRAIYRNEVLRKNRMK